MEFYSAYESRRYRHIETRVQTLARIIEVVVFVAVKCGRLVSVIEVRKVTAGVPQQSTYVICDMCR
jgi:hypothetical protein